VRGESRILRPVATASLLLALCLPVPSHAVWQWLRGAAATDFKDSDWAMLRETALRVLNDLPDREQANWSNPETGNKGSVMALVTFQYQGQKCRRAAMRNITNRGRDDRSAYTLCQQVDGDWIFVPESAIREAAAAEAVRADPQEADPQEADAAATADDSEP
jgi:surface antigen